MAIKTNKELVQAVNVAIKESGYKKNWIADQLGISRQALTHFLQKANFSIDDANKILSIIGYKASAKVDKNILQKVDKNDWQVKANMLLYTCKEHRDKEKSQFQTKPGNFKKAVHAFPSTRKV